MTLALRSAVVAATVAALASAVAFEALVAQEIGARRGGTGITSPEVAADVG